MTGGTLAALQHLLMAQMIRPSTVIVWYRNVPYQLDLERCRRAFDRLVASGELRGMRDLACKIGIRRSTASRFFAGRRTSLTVTLKILKALNVTMADVRRSLDDDPTGPDGGAAGGRVRPKSGPTCGGDGAAVASTAA
jgi:Helix-turn-helix